MLKKNNQQKKPENRYRHFSFLAYPESCPSASSQDELFAKCKQLWSYCAVGPIHDKDKDDKDDIKKAHYHIIVFFPNKKSLEKLYDEIISSKMFALKSEMKVNNLMSAIRYLVHADNNDKYRYDWRLILCNIPGINLYEIFSELQSYSDKYNFLLSLIEENDILDAYELDNFLRFSDYSWLLEFKNRCAYALGQYLTAKAKNHKKISDEVFNFAEARAVPF